MPPAAPSPEVAVLGPSSNQHVRVRDTHRHVVELHAIRFSTQPRAISQKALFSFMSFALTTKIGVCSAVWLDSRSLKRRVGRGSSPSSALPGDLSLGG